MDAAATFALALGKQALDTLNNWLDDVDVAKSWYGDNYSIFTRPAIGPTSLRRKIRHVFTIKKDDWQKVIEQCLADCYTWHRHAGGGECCWLRIFMSLPKEMRGGFLQKPQSSLSSLAIIESLPAARIDLWGLVVLTFANGVTTQSVREGSTGSFYAKLCATNFVLTIWQYNMAGPISAHIEPKDQGSRVQTMLTSPEWNHLLWEGHTFKECHHIFGWPLSGEPPAEAPHDLITNMLNGELSQIIMDNQWVGKLQKQLRSELYACHDRWGEFLDEVQDEKFKNKIEKIRQNLLAFKLLLVDESPAPEEIIQEQRMADTLHYSERQLAIVEEEIHQQVSRDHVEFDIERAQSLCSKLETNILPLQQKVVALVRLLTLPKRVIPHLSTRGTGTHVSLA